ncbi:dienelactone hydrolase family protein [Arthrobacter sp. 31Y]|uniref:dienelactone hydrolase family protein n=1 Tax=Arthrobacter sp. 31Y TaxID=1115632 RepID=UPI000464FB3E|nr:dienelactone hydrolase family protein [Arthrobacter sp. 31Y]
MVQLEKFEKYLIEEFYDDYRSGDMSHKTFTRRVAFIMGSMTAAAAAMTLVGCTPDEVPRSTDPMPTPSPTSSAASPGSATTAVPNAKSPLSVPEGAAGLVTATVTFTSGGTEISGYVARPEGSQKGPAVLICHENRGLTPHIQDVARRFAKEGYAALALDLLSREGGTANMDPDAVPGALTQAGAQRHVNDFKAAFVFLNDQDFFDEGRIAMVGFCFGGGITWQASTEIPALKATSSFYGPAPDLAKVPTIKPAVFGVYAENDARITGAMPQLQQALGGTTVKHGGERYVEAQATAAWNDTLAWFKDNV